MKRLFIDLEVCNRCLKCMACCDYFCHGQNNGITNLREYASFAVFCRRCEEAPCVNSCYHQALEKQPEGIVKRYKMRCTSCKCCAIACPFGTIFPDFIPYIDSRCDYCVVVSGKLPRCVASCPDKAVEIKEVEESIEKDIYFVGESLAVHSTRWTREDIQLRKK